MSQLKFNRFALDDRKPGPVGVVIAEDRRNKQRRVYALMTEEEAQQRNKNDFYSWRANWTRGYKSIVLEIRGLKENIRNKNTTEGQKQYLHARLTERRAIARSMMMALEAEYATFEATRLPKVVKTETATTYEETEEELLDKAEQRLSTQ